MKEVSEDKAFFVDYSVVLETAISASFGKAPRSPEETGLHISYHLLDKSVENNSSIPWTFFFQRGANPWARTRFD